MRCSRPRTSAAELSVGRRYRGRCKVSSMIPGTKIQNDQQGRCLVFDKGLTEETFPSFLNALMREGIEFNFYDPKYPSPSDPGAYLSYSPQNGEWLMTLGNHGWSGGIYNIETTTISRQLYNLYALGRLTSVGLDRVCFFKHYQPESVEKNEQMNWLLQEIHA